MKYDFAPPGYVGCHSERSEESLMSSGAIRTENSQRCFASLNMTALFMRGSMESVRQPAIFLLSAPLLTHQFSRD